MWTLRSIRLGLCLTPRVPAPLGYTFCWLIALLLATCRRSARRNVLHNLSVVCPAQRPAARRRAMLRVFFTVVANYYDLARLWTVDRNRVGELLEVQGEEHLRRAVAQGKGAVIVAPHVGNYGVVPQFATVLGCEVGLVAERIEPAALFDELAMLRSALGIRIIPADGRAALAVMRILRRGGLIILAGDRDVLGTGEPIRFFGREARLPAGPVILARRSGAALLPAVTRRRSWRRSALRIAPPIPLERTDQPEADLHANLARVAAALEDMIATAPDQWAVLQPVWARLPAAGQPSSAASITR